ncbi:IS200/IS605 family transposase [Cyanobacterium stanieri LEGE 03274]|uniref:IS200/IS605 family transposase n=1 Tax=Cyanobacterium stanieri LEGE 03274 TaxID=1828756 RepID=A0ABR9V0G9_9CHRO|nr:IS200/IS605 family transposase [Cyanobacterium stanieri]MBE9221373.1 IS200/IS605 family transposase [Cyanobacterium stanieri LEGE 03274]
MAYWQLYYHIVWATKERLPLINFSIEERLHKYIVNKSKEFSCIVHGINSMPNHIHLLVSIPPNMAVSEYVRKIKGSSSNFVGKIDNNAFYWQNGYGIFTVGKRGLPMVIDYIKNQKQHHRDNTIINELEKINF